MDDPKNYSRSAEALEKWKEDPTEVYTRGYGLLRSRDPKDKLHPLRPNLKLAARTTVKHWTVSTILDQGATPHCVGFSGWNYLAGSPVRNKPAFKPAFLYGEAQLADEWPGTDYDGTSVRGLFKVLKKLEFVTEYLWAEDAQTVVAHLLTAGPVVMGTDWFQGMDKPGPKTYLWPDGEMLGGHAWLATGADKLRKNPDGTMGAIRMVNSWGKSWGEKGRAWVSFDSLDKLVKGFGEAAVAKEVLV